MSEIEYAKNLLDSVPAYKLGYVIAYIQGICADERADDEFCEKLCEEYEADSDKGQFVSFDEMMKKCEVEPNEI